MDFFKSQISMESDSRLTTLEVSFVANQKSIEKHIERQEQAFVTFNNSLNTLVSQNDNKMEKIVLTFQSSLSEMSEHNDNQLKQLKIDICEKISGQYATTKEVNIAIRDSEKLLFTKFTAIGTGVMAIATFIGWLYIESHKTGFIP